MITILLWCAVCFKIISCHWGNGEKHRIDFATKIAKYRLYFRQPDSLSRNRLDFPTKINPILCPGIDSIFRQKSTRFFALKSTQFFDKNQPDSLSRNHLRSIIERCGQHNNLQPVLVLSLSAYAYRCTA